MPSFQEFMSRRQAEQQSGQQQPSFTQNFGRPQAVNNQAQQPNFDTNKNYSNVASGQMKPENNAAPTSGGSSVNSSGRVTAGGAPPLWQQQQQQSLANDDMGAKIAAMQQHYQDGLNAGQDMSWMKQQSNAGQQNGQMGGQRNEFLNPASYQRPTNQFDPNNFKPVTSDPAQQEFWNFAMREQQGQAPGVNMFDTLQAGTPVSGSPGEVWQQNPNGVWGTAKAPVGPQEPKLPNNMPQFNPMQYSQFNQQQGQNGLLDFLMANPESMDPNTISQMKQAQTEEASSMNRQLQEAIQNDAAGRGVTGGAGEHAAMAQGNRNMMQDILSGHRDTDIRANAQNRQDVLNAFGAGMQGYEGQLKGQGLQDTSNQFGATFGQGQVNDILDNLFRNYGVSNANDQAGINRTWTSGENNANRALQDKLGMAGIGVDQGRLNETARQFDKMFPLNEAQIMGNLGIGYGNLDLNNRQFASDSAFRDKNAFLNWLGIGG